MAAAAWPQRSAIAAAEQRGAETGRLTVAWAESEHWQACGSLNTVTADARSPATTVGWGSEVATGWLLELHEALLSPQRLSEIAARWAIRAR